VTNALRTGLIAAMLCLCFLAGQALTSAAHGAPTGGASFAAGVAEPSTAKPRALQASPRDLAVLRRIAACESGGDPRIVSPDGLYRGKYQFSRSTWQAMGGSGDPAAAPELEQDRRAHKLLRQAGVAPWPHCGPRALR
jgi:hypothetical protein